MKPFPTSRNSVCKYYLDKSVDHLHSLVQELKIENVEDNFFKDIVIPLSVYLDVLPKKELVNIVSYAASSTDNLSMNVKTLAGEDKPHLNIADFIQYFNENDNFVDNFVSSISSGTNEDGEEILTFSFTNSYVGDFSAFKAVEVDTPKVEQPVEKIERT